jgi:hypothetical protein
MHGSRFTFVCKDEDLSLVRFVALKFLQRISHKTWGSSTVFAEERASQAGHPRSG